MLSDLILSLRELQETETRCNRCGLCQSVCPIYRRTGHEADVARGRLSLIDGLVSEILKNPEAIKDQLEKCLLCGACTASCSRRVNTIEIFIRARLILNDYIGLSFFRKAILRAVISKPAVFDRAVRFIRRNQGLFGRKREGDVLTMRLYAPYLKGRNLYPVAPASFHSITKEKAPASDIFFFAGCLIDKLIPETGNACVKTLEFHGYTPMLSPGEGCCGMPALSSGDIVSFNRLVEHNLKLIQEKKSSYVVTACATCTFTLRKLWPMLYSGEQQSAVRAISEKVVDIHQFITEISGTFPDQETILKNASGKKVTVHDPCHLKKSLGISKEPRDILKAIPGLTLTEMDEPDTCCGFGGTFSLKNAELSSKIGGGKCNEIASTEADIVATGCPACMMQLRDQLLQNGMSTEVRHIIDLYAASIPD